MAQKIIKIGSSVGVTLPKNILQKLKLQSGSEIELQFNRNRGSIEIIPLQMDEAQIDPLALRAIKLVNKHQNELSKLPALTDEKR